MEQDWKVKFYVYNKPFFKIVRAKTAAEARAIVAEGIVRNTRFLSTEAKPSLMAEGDALVEQLFGSFKKKK